MGIREDAQEFLDQMHSCHPKHFFNEVGETQRGIGFVLMYLREAEGEVIAGDLARVMHVSTARIAVLLEKIEKNRWITKHKSASDARRTVVEITPEGIQYTESVKEHMLEKAQLLIEKVGKEDLKEFIRIAHKINAVFEEQ